MFTIKDSIANIIHKHPIKTLFSKKISAQNLFLQSKLRKYFTSLMVLCLLVSAFLLARKAAELSASGSAPHIRSSGQGSAEHPRGSSGSSTDPSGTRDGNSHGKRRTAIVVDAGHGGNDPGKIGVNHQLEKDLNLAIAEKLGRQLKKEGLQVTQTRTSDTSLAPENSPSTKRADLQQRINLIEQTNPALTVSIHQNSFSASSACGPQVFYYSDSPEGRALASCIQDSLNSALAPPRPRVVKANSSYYLLRRSACPTVIVECGFLSNPAEAELLADPAYQKKAAAAICSGILEYLE